MEYFATADTHFGHANIIKYCNRPFSFEEHDEALIENWNKTVTRNDIIIVAGDFSFHKDVTKNEQILSRLKGKKCLVKGNHDYKIPNGFEWVKDYFELKLDKQFFAIMHYPMLSWNKSFHGSKHLYGHVHNEPTFIHPSPNAFNVGVDVRGFKPVRILSLGSEQ